MVSLSVGQHYVVRKKVPTHVEMKARGGHAKEPAAKVGWE